MRLFKSITVAALLLMTQLPALGAELAVLRNGFSIRFEHKEQTGNVTRLYTGTGYVDVASDQIASFEAEEAPVAPLPEVAATAPSPSPSIATAQPAPSATTAQPVLLPAATAKPSQAVSQAASAANLDLDQVVREAAKRNRLDPDFVNSVIKAESNFKTRAVSPKGAQGLMQLMPATAAQLGVTDPFDAKANVEAGTAHLSALLDKYHDDPVKALAAYNAGAHRVKQYNGVPPYRETRAYIAKIVRDFNAKKRAEMKTAVAKTNAPSKPAAAPAKSANAKTARKSKPQQAASLAGGN
jgi:soluble lytic murein transglycosylase-like protein